MKAHGAVFRIFASVFARLRPLHVLLVRLGGMALVYTLLRCLFWLLNRDQFPSPPLPAFLGGIRFDLSALAWLNLPWVLLALVHPAPSPRFARIQLWVFVGLNAIGLFFNCVDIAYYGFTLKRSTADLFGIMGGGGDLLSLAPVFIRDYWHIVLIHLASIVSTWWVYRWAERLPLGDGPARPRWLWRLLAVVVVVICARGGVQLIPLKVLNASLYAEPAYMPVVLNTPFTILMSLGKPVIEEQRYMSDAEAGRLWPVVHQYGDTAITGNRPNVVLIILESFSANYSKLLSGGAPGYMPFLDSLMANGLTYDRAYANGRRSVDGVPAILAAMPKLMEDAFINSPAADVPFTSLANVLAAEGYATSFFHGGRNGTMGFDAFTRSAGYQLYVGQDEYPNAADNDGIWGIRDEPFLQYFAKELDRMPQPFHSTVFTLSSHHPYHLPENDAHRFAAGTMPIHPTLRYTDHALQQFFATASKMPWYANTLFVITADHTADLKRDGQLSGTAFDHWIPLVYYMPGRIQPRMEHRTTQQIDILATTLDLLGHKKPFFSFGASTLREERNPASVSEGNATWMIITDEVQLRSDGEQVLWSARMREGLTSVAPLDSSELALPNTILQAAVQQYHAHLLNRDMFIVK
jgi:hypothetical protein